MLEFLFLNLDIYLTTIRSLSDIDQSGNVLQTSIYQTKIAFI